MSHQPDIAGDNAHRATQECLPWLLNGTLGGAELAAAQAHLRACPVCQADLAGLRLLRDVGNIADPQCDPDRALAQLMARIEASGQATGEAAVPAAASREASGPRRAANDPHWLRRALFAQCGLIVLLAALLAWPGEGGERWRALGAAPAGQGQAVVVFRPETPERELRRIVRMGGARIVGGPTVTDAWVLAVPEGQWASLLAQLRAEPAVLLAEPLAQEGAP